MPLTTIKLVGSIYPPDSASTGGVIMFELSNVVSDSAGIVVPRTVATPILANGSIDVNIWPNARGSFPTWYTVYEMIPPAMPGQCPQRRVIGTIELPATPAVQDITDFIALTPVPLPSANFWSSITQAEYDEIISGIDLVNGPSQLVISREARLNFGFNGVTDTQIFPNAERASQGLAIAEIGGVKTAFVLQRVAGSTFLTNERHRIAFAPYTGNDQDTTPSTWTAELALGHQGLSHFYQAGALKLVSQIRTVTGHTGTDAGKGISVINWNGAATVDADVDNHQLFGYAGSGHQYQSLYGATPCVSADGQWLVMIALDTNVVDGGDGDELQDSTNWMLIYRLADVLAAADPLTVNPVSVRAILQPDRGDGLQYTQGVACDGRSVWILRGYANPQGRQQIIRYSMIGDETQVIDSDFARAAYTLADLQGASGVIGVSFEPEGLALDGGDLVGLFLDNRRNIGSTVTFEGKIFSAVATTLVGGTYYSPRNGLYWIETPTATPSGPWVDGVSYAPGTYTRRRKTLWRVHKPVGGANEKPLSIGMAARSSGASVFLPPNEVNVAIKDGETLQVAAFSEATQLYYSLMHLKDGKNLRLFDARPGADNAVYGQWGMNTVGGRGIAEFRMGGTMALGAGWNAYLASDIDNPHQFWITAGGEWVVKLDADGFMPGTTPGLPVMLYSSAVPVAHTGTTAKTAIRTVSIPANALGPNGFLTVEFEAYTADNTANNKIVTLEYGGTIIHETAADGLDSTRNYGQQIWMHNANSNSAQTFRAIGAANAYGTSTSTGARSGTVNSAVAQNLVLSFTLGLGTETISLQRFTVYATYQP